MGARKCFILPVPNRNAETITQIISQNILPGTKIITDQWRAYNRAINDLENIHLHDSIKHSIHFVDPKNPELHTQNIEGIWRRSKYFIRRRRGINRKIQSQLLVQFIWEYNIDKKKRFNVLTSLLSHF
jgi:hypothetical protein